MALFYAAQGAPTNGTSGTLVGTACQGDVYEDLLTNIIYDNIGSKVSPNWAARPKTDTSGNLTVAAALTVSGKVVEPPSAGQTVVAGTTIAANAGFLQINSASALTITAHPAIATTGVATGTKVYLQNTNASNAVTLTDDGTDSGSAVKLRTGTTLALAAGLIYCFLFDGTVWREVV